MRTPPFVAPPSGTSGARDYATGAEVDTTTLTLMVDVGALSDVLAPTGRLSLERVPEAPPGQHPVCIDFWHVHGGRAELRGVDQHTLSELAGAATGALTAGTVGASYGALTGAGAGGMTGLWLGPVGWWWGATAGWLVGAAMGGATGASYGATVSGRAARGASTATAEALGTYNEVIITIPHVLPRGGGGPYQFVVGMHTDSALGRWLDEAYGFGLNKRMASFPRAHFTGYEVHAPDGLPLASATLAPEAPARWRPAREAPGLATVLRWQSQPLLGHLGRERFAVSYLSRFYDAPAVRVAPVSGRLSVCPGFAPCVPPGERAFGPVEAGRCAGAFQATRVPVKFTYPEPLGG